MVWISRSCSSIVDIRVGACSTSASATFGTNSTSTVSMLGLRGYSKSAARKYCVNIARVSNEYLGEEIVEPSVPCSRRGLANVQDMCAADCLKGRRQVGMCSALVPQILLQRLEGQSDHSSMLTTSHVIRWATGCMQTKESGSASILLSVFRTPYDLWKGSATTLPHILHAGYLQPHWAQYFSYSSPTSSQPSSI